jgi:DeoR/GlpR family transcriptional regulator of sugar metabolism
MELPLFIPDETVEGEVRFHGCITVEETAAALQVSQETVMRDWKFAKAWLLRELSHEESP